MSTEDKTCASCGRRIEWRKKWARDWESVRYCSDACRRRKVTAEDRALEAAILARLASGAGGRTADPDDAARAVARERGVEDWSTLAEPARRAARRLVASGDVVFLQGGREVDPSTAKGPIRVRRT